MAGSRIDLEAELDRLFALRLEDFVSARNALAARLKASGDAPAAGRINIKALKKPSVPAWAVNQLRFAAPRILAALLASGDRLRSRSSDMQSAMQERREAVAAARKKVEELLVAGGHAATPQTMQRVTSTLEALATYGNAPDRAMKVAGRLTEELPAPGFDDLAALGILRAAGAPTRRRAAGTPPRRVAGIPPARIPSAPVPPLRVVRVAEKTEAARARERATWAKELSAKRREAEKLRARLVLAEKKAVLARGTRQKLEAALANVSREESKEQEVADAARKAVAAAEEALREAGEKLRSLR